MRTQVHSTTNVKKEFVRHDHTSQLLPFIDEIIDMEYLNLLKLGDLLKRDKMKNYDHNGGGYDREYARKIVQAVHDALCAREIETEMQRAIEAVRIGEYSKRLSIWQDIVDCYPWFAHAHWELAIAKDEFGDVDGALSSIEAAIALEPTKAAFWRSLNVIYNKLPARSEETRFAHAVTAMLLERERGQ